MKDILYYDPSSKSCLRWCKNHKEAGYLDNTGYYRVSVKGRKYQAHRLVLHLEKGFDLKDKLFVDHIDRNRENNLVENLRVVTQQENNINRALPKPSYCKQTGKWKAIGRDSKWLGRFDSYDKAQEVINESETK
ncbi:MAG: HNH endonuclease signature motif containing protein [Cetobacterium sp.]|uniref:HNH endonuclease signature motif containing protein n=1 Tax=Cetobacterium sp. TaxID=2071632 RepID=UPI003EE4D5E1